MKIATYNIQNLFHRHIDLINGNHVMKMGQWSDEFESLLKKLGKKDSDYRRMRELADLMGLHQIGKTDKFARGLLDSAEPSLRTMPRRLESHLRVRRNMQVVPIPERAVRNKTRVVQDVDPDILLLQEVESRSSLIEFNTIVFEEKEETGFKEIIHLDGNGCNGLGMGILLKDGYRVRAIRSFSSERDIDGSMLFTNDLQSYKIETPIGRFLYVLNVQLVSDSSNRVYEEKRTRQANLVSRVYEELRSNGNELIVVLGTLNAPKYSKSLSPLMESDVVNISELSNFDVELDHGFDSGYFRMGAYRKGVNVEQNDYLLTSPSIKDSIYASGMNRKGVWPLKRPDWDTYDSLENERDSASEHPLLWVCIDMEKPLAMLKKSA